MGADLSVAPTRISEDGGLIQSGGLIPLSSDGELAEFLSDYSIGEFPETNACERTRPLGAATEDLEALGAPSFTLVEPTLWGQIKALFYRSL